MATQDSRATDGRPAPLSVRSNFVWSLAGNVLYAFCQFGVLFVLAKLCSAETVGLYVLGIAVTSPIFLFAGLQLRRLQATDTNEEFQFGHYFTLQLLACGLAMLACAVAGWSSGYRNAALAVILLVGFSKAIETLSNTFYGFLQQHERLDRISKSMALQSLLSAVGLCGGVVLTGDIVWACAWSAGLRLLAVFLYDVPSLLWVAGQDQRLSARRLLWERGPLWQLAVMGVPLGVTSMLVSLNTNFPRYFVESYRSTAELGIFGMLCAPLYVMHTLTKALESSASARLARLHTSGDVRGFRRLFWQLLGTHTGFALAGVAVAWLFGRPLLTLLFKAEYAEHVDVFVTIMWATLVATSAGVMMTALIAARFIQIQLPLMAVTSVAALAACWWLVPSFGMTGAAWSLAISKLPYLVVGLWLIARMSESRRHIPCAVSPETADSIRNVPAPKMADGTWNVPATEPARQDQLRKGAA
ncbi:MAG: lipopolysaccharide biosynthesis protein [Planctomycetaceae bacterium]